MQFASPSTQSTPQASVEVLSALPLPLFVVSAQDPKWPVTMTNPAFDELVEPPAVGRPLADLLDLRLDHAAGEPLADQLAAVRDHRVARTIRVSAPDGENRLAPHWSLTLSPLAAAGEVTGIVGVLVADAEEPGQSRGRRDVLRTMASGLVGERTREEVLRDGIAEAATTAGARRAAVMLSDGGESFRVVATLGEADLPDTFTVPATADALIDVAMGRRHLALPVDDSRDTDPAAALPFAGHAGWDQVLVVGLRVRAGGLGLLAVADPADGHWDDRTLERLQLAAVLFGAALEGTELRHQFERIEELLRGAVLASTALMGHTDPAQVRRALVERIVADMHLAGAALWVSDSEQAGSAVLVASAGLPPEVRQAVAALPSHDPVADTAAGNIPWRIPSDAVAAQAWPERHLHLLPVPQPAEGALGIYTVEPLPGPALDIFAALAQAMASGVEQTTLHRRARSVVDSLQRGLQPRVFELPPGLEAGHIYRSATAGVPIGGDFLDVFSTATGHIGLACGDVSGKGIEAAILSAMAVYSLRAFALQGAMPRIVVSMMDAAVEAQTGDDRFLTMAYARIQPREWSVELCNAGHPTPVIVGPQGARLLEIAADVPVGMLGTSVYDQVAFNLAPGESLVLYTDGVTEARSGEDSRVMFGTTRLVETLQTLRSADAQTIADGVWKRVQEWSAGETTDDCAVVVLRRCPDEVT